MDCKAGSGLTGTPLKAFLPSLRLSISLYGWVFGTSTYILTELQTDDLFNYKGGSRHKKTGLGWLFWGEEK